MYEKTGGRTAGVRSDGHAAAGRIHGLFCGLRETLIFRPDRFGGRSGICHDEDHFGRSSRFLGRDAPV